jgi:ActD protein
VSVVYALYGDGDTAQRAVDALRATGLADREITVISSEPMEDYDFGTLDRRSRLWYVASAGGFAGFVIATWLTRMTELAWPLPTGNMPIVAWWPNLIIMFELTMLGAILATVGTMIVAAGLARRRPALYDPEVSNGKILVGVDSPRDRGAVEHALTAGGATTVVNR